jgi:hypothetical protein
MKRALALVLAALAVGPAAATAAEKRLLVNGDSLAEGTRPYIPRELPDCRTGASGSPPR